MSTRDYKDAGQAARTRARRARRKAPPENGGYKLWIWVLLGLVIGGGLALAPPVRVLITRTVDALEAVTAPAPDRQAAPRKVDVLDPPDTDAPQFEFYEILPEMEVVIPAEELESMDERQTGYLYRLQVGSFASRADAEQLKARCALLGFEAQLVPVQIDGSTRYRVRIGPFERARDTDITRRRLFDNGIDSIVLREPLPVPGD